MTDAEAGTFEAELVEGDAERSIAKAVSVRHSIARKVVLRARRRAPDATPAEVIQQLERQYVIAISAAGAVVAAGAIAAGVGIALIPGARIATTGAVKAGEQVAKKAALGAAALLPAGQEQLQFELTAIFALALADIHGMDLDKQQAHALVYGLSNERVSQRQIATMATDLAVKSPGGAVTPAQPAGHDVARWANTLATMLPGGAARSLVGVIQTGRLDTTDLDLSGKQQTAIEYGVGALAGGVTRFMFGRKVVEAARVAFADAPDTFPAHLPVPLTAEPDDGEDEPNRAFVALEDAAKAAGTWISGAAGAAGAGVATAAGTVTRPFRSVDLDGDGVPDAPQALTAVKGVGGAITGAVGGAAASLFRGRKLGRHAAGRKQLENPPPDADQTPDDQDVVIPPRPEA